MRLLSCLLAALSLALASPSAQAQPYPNKPITIIVPFGAGSATDTITRVLAQHLSVALNSDLGYAATEVEQNLDRVFALAPAGARGDVPVRWLWAAWGGRVRGNAGQPCQSAGSGSGG